METAPGTSGEKTDFLQAKVRTHQETDRSCQNTGYLWLLQMPRFFDSMARQRTPQSRGVCPKQALLQRTPELWAEQSTAQNTAETHVGKQSCPHKKEETKSLEVVAWQQIQDDQKAELRTPPGVTKSTSSIPSTSYVKKCLGNTDMGVVPSPIPMTPTAVLCFLSGSFKTSIFSAFSGFWLSLEQCLGELSAASHHCLLRSQATFAFSHQVGSQGMLFTPQAGQLLVGVPFPGDWHKHPMTVCPTNKGSRHTKPSLLWPWN